MSRRLRIAALLVVSACSSREAAPPSLPSTPFDAGDRDAAPSVDAGMDASRPADAAMDASMDAAMDAAMDARVPSFDASPRDGAAVDAPPDRTDAGRPIRDIGIDAPPPGCGFGLEGVCTGGAASIYDGPCDARELHIVGQYQPDASGTTTVTIARTGAPVVLSVSSYEPTTWNIVVEPGAVLEQILVDGYNTQTVVVAGGIPVDNRSGPGGDIACATRWPRDPGGCDTEALVASLARRTGLRPSSFIGCYEGSSYRIAD
jgi:hypothetical protein